jgi:hypothetical protein
MGNRRKIRALKLCDDDDDDDMMMIYDHDDDDGKMLRMGTWDFTWIESLQFSHCLALIVSNLIISSLS